MTAARKIEHQDLLTTTFKNQGTMYAQEQLQSRHQKLYMAMLLGNHFHNNVRIIFNTEDGIRETISRVWATTDRHVVLKGGMFIPIKAILDVVAE